METRNDFNVTFHRGVLWTVVGRGEGMEERKGLKSRTPDFYYHVTTRNLSLKVNDPNNDLPPA